MRFSVWPNPGRSWPDVAAIVGRCDASGWDGAYFADHFMPDDPGGRPQDGAILESGAVLAALCARTERVRLGALVSGNLYRHPAVLAKAAATMDHISGGRFILGIGAGWQVNEHAAYGIDLLPVKDRLDRFEEACAVVSSLLREQRTTFSGRWYRIEDAPCEPRPVNGKVPVLVGGGGERRTLRIAARYADEWNTWSTPEVFRHKSAVLDSHCEALERDPASIRRSTQALVFLSRDQSWLAERRGRGMGQAAMIGTPEEVAEQVAAFRDAGVDELIVPDFTMGGVERTLDTLELFWNEVAAQFR